MPPSYNMPPPSPELAKLVLNKVYKPAFIGAFMSCLFYFCVKKRFGMEGSNIAFILLISAGFVTGAYFGFLDLNKTVGFDAFFQPDYIPPPSPPKKAPVQLDKTEYTVEQTVQSNDAGRSI